VTLRTTSDAGTAVAVDDRGRYAQAEIAHEPRFTPDQATRVLHRAIALESERIRRVDEDMSLQQLIDVGDEIGLSEADIRTAAALEWFDAPPDRGGVVLRAAGAPVARAQRVVDRDHRQVGRQVEEWVRVAHCMKVRYRDGDAVRWEPTGGLLGGIRRGARHIAGETVIDGLEGITTRVSPIGDGRTAVSVEFDPGSRERTLSQAGVAGGALVGAGVVGGLAVTAAAALLVPLGLVVGIGIIAARRRTLDASQREIQRLMSGVAHGERPPTALDAVRRRLRARTGEPGR